MVANFRNLLDLIRPTSGFRSQHQNNTVSNGWVLASSSWRFLCPAAGSCIQTPPIQVNEKRLLAVNVSSISRTALAWIHHFKQHINGCTKVSTSNLWQHFCFWSCYVNPLQYSKQTFEVKKTNSVVAAEVSQHSVAMVQTARVAQRIRLRVLQLKSSNHELRWYLQANPLGMWYFSKDSSCQQYSTSLFRVDFGFSPIHLVKHFHSQFSKAYSIKFVPQTCLALLDRKGHTDSRWKGGIRGREAGKKTEKEKTKGVTVEECF